MDNNGRKYVTWFHFTTLGLGIVVVPIVLGMFMLERHESRPHEESITKEEFKELRQDIKDWRDEMKNDISELAQAKGANVAGLGILSKESGVAFEELEVFYLAGGFARHLDIDAARRIGLIPSLPNSRYSRLGNAALEGATIALLSLSRREELETLVTRAVHVELETNPDFFDYFVDGCLFNSVERRGEGASHDA